MFDSSQVLDFANTRLDRPTGRVERLTDPAQAGRWLFEQLGFGDGQPLSDAGYVRLLEARDVIRRLIAARAAHESPTGPDLELINRTSADAPRSDALTGQWQRTDRFLAADPRHGQDDLTVLRAMLATAAIALVSQPDVDLAECAAHDCVILFQRTDPRRRWHSERCGNRVRAARSYARRRPPSAAD